MSVARPSADDSPSRRPRAGGRPDGPYLACGGLGSCGLVGRVRAQGLPLPTGSVWGEDAGPEPEGLIFGGPELLAGLLAVLAFVVLFSLWTLWQKWLLVRHFRRPVDLLEARDLADLAGRHVALLGWLHFLVTPILGSASVLLGRGLQVAGLGLDQVGLVLALAALGCGLGIRWLVAVLRQGLQD